MICANCLQEKECGGFTASMVRNNNGIIIGFKAGWLCKRCSSLPAVSIHSNRDWLMAAPVVEKKGFKPKLLPSPAEKVDDDIEKLKLELLQFDENERDKQQEETHKQFKLFCKKYFNEQ